MLDTVCIPYILTDVRRMQISDISMLMSYTGWRILEVRVLF